MPFQMRNPFFRSQQPQMPPPMPPPQQDFGFKYPQQEESRPMLDAYKQLLMQAPQHEKPSILRTILSSLVGGAAGFGGGVGAGMQAGKTALDAPYDRAVEDFGLKAKTAATGAELENTGIENKNRYFRDFNATRSAELGAQNSAADNVRADAQLKAATDKQANIQQFYDAKNKREQDEFDAKKAGGYFRKYPPKYIGAPGGGTGGKPPTQTNMDKAEHAATEQVVAMAPQFEQFVQRNPYNGQIIGIKGPSDPSDQHQAVQFEQFMMVRQHHAQRRLKGGFGVPGVSGDNHAAITGNSQGSQTSNTPGPDADYEY